MGLLQLGNPVFDFIVTNKGVMALTAIDRAVVILGVGVCIFFFIVILISKNPPVSNSQPLVAVDSWWKLKRYLEVQTMSVHECGYHRPFFHAF